MLRSIRTFRRVSPSGEARQIFLIWQQKLTETPLLATLWCMRQEIEALLSRSAAAWSAGDLDAFMECYEDAPDTVYLSSTRLVSGYAAIRAMYAERFGPTMGRLEFNVLQLKPIETSHVLVVGAFRLEGRSGNWSLLLRKTSRGWRISADHTSH
jgi:ketosteroid isomerase-like protein